MNENLIKSYLAGNDLEVVEDAEILSKNGYVQYLEQIAESYSIDNVNLESLFTYIALFAKDNEFIFDINGGDDDEIKNININIKDKTVYVS